MNPYDYKYLLVDSRSVFDAPATVFAAIRTDLADGHDYIPQLYDLGVRAFIAERRPEGCPDAEFMIVDNVADTVAELARRRPVPDGKGVVVTGSVGKTIVKELIWQALTRAGKHVLRSPRSWNSSIGLPLAVLDMTSASTDADAYIIEAGIDAPGQAARLADVLGTSCTTGVITPITAEHDEAFDSHAQKIEEKLRLVAGCKTVYYADTDPELKRRVEALPGVKAVAVEQGSHPTIFHALAAAVTGGRGDVDTLQPVNKRREISSAARGNTIIRDNFTADIRSLREALDFMRRQSGPSTGAVLILGRLVHRPDEPEVSALYAEARRLAAHFGVDRVLTVSPEVADAEPLDLSGLRDRRILIFGEADDTLTDIADSLEAAAHDSTLEVDLDALVHNYNHYRSLVPAGTGIVAMVKASAYGMGAVEVGKALQSNGAAYLAVAVIDEGIALRQAGITMPLMVLNPVTNRYTELFDKYLEPAVFSIDELRRLVSEAKKAGVRHYPVHIKLDTGMHRVGFTRSQLGELLDELRSTDAVRVESVFSHLATADCLDMDDYTRGQLDLFAAMSSDLSDGLGYTFRRHILNTAGMMRFADTGGYEMARLGIGLYGISPYKGTDGDALRPVATFRSRIISLKHWPAGTPIGYGCKGRTTAADSIIATVPVGYADGVNRRLGNGATSFIVRGVECPTIGNICMDLCMIDVTAVPGVAVGDEVEIFGKNKPVELLAEILGTIPYELLTSVSPRVRRIYVKR